MLSLSLSGINWLAVGASFAAVMVLGFVWFARFAFGKRWMELVGLTEEKARSGAAKALGFAVVLGILEVLGTAVLFELIHVASMVDGLVAGAILGVAIVLPTTGVQHIFAGRPMALMWIHVAHHLVEFLLIGGILGGWQ
jgi:hypothetical protein